MWIASTIGWFSAVKDNQATGRIPRVLVRARCKADIYNLFRKFKGQYFMTRPSADESRDYRWRVTMRRSDWAKILAELGEEISYSNFKNAVSERVEEKETKKN